jgi:hypothetical protein
MRERREKIGVLAADGRRQARPPGNREKLSDEDFWLTIVRLPPKGATR